MDVARVETLLAERTALRKSRDFDGADVLRDELYSMGVTVLDREMRWFVGARQGYRGDDGGRGQQQERSGARGGGRAPFDPVQFGPLGHDYRQTGATEDLTVLDEATLATVHSLLASRRRQTPALAVPELGSCASSGRLAALGGSTLSPGTGGQPSSRVLASRLHREFHRLCIISGTATGS